MNILVEIFNKVLYQPLFNVLAFLYHWLPGNDFGIAVIILTILIRLALYPLMSKSLKSQKVFRELQPKIKEIQKKFKDDQKKQTEELLNLYREAKINPIGGFLPLLIQLPLLIALYQVFWRGLEPGAMNSLYSFMPVLGEINPSFLGIVNLSQASIFLAVLAGTVQFFQAKTMNPKQKKQKSQIANIMQKQMLYFLPLFTVIILLRLPAAIALYLIVTSLFSIAQQYNVNKNHVKSN
ncbi:MAG: YidC/Oxa1 family membrane protein insertase [Candidatus Nealsonbacteria bacterium]